MSKYRGPYLVCHLSKSNNLGHPRRHGLLSKAAEDMNNRLNQSQTKSAWILANDIEVLLKIEKHELSYDYLMSLVKEDKYLKPIYPDENFVEIFNNSIDWYSINFKEIEDAIESLSYSEKCSCVSESYVFNIKTKECLYKYKQKEGNNE